MVEDFARFKLMPDSRPVAQAELVAAQWYPDDDFKIGIVQGPFVDCVDGGLYFVNSATHMVRIMTAEEILTLFDSMDTAITGILLNALPEISKDDLKVRITSTSSGGVINTPLKKLVLAWINGNYKRE